jgi:hypothetical protein
LKLNYWRIVFVVRIEFRLVGIHRFHDDKKAGFAVARKRSELSFATLAQTDCVAEWSG